MDINYKKMKIRDYCFLYVNFMETHHKEIERSLGITESNKVFYYVYAMDEYFGDLGYKFPFKYYLINDYMFIYKEDKFLLGVTVPSEFYKSKLTYEVESWIQLCRALIFALFERLDLIEDRGLYDELLTESFYLITNIDNYLN